MSRRQQGSDIFPFSTLTDSTLPSSLPDRRASEIRSTQDRRGRQTPQCGSQGLTGSLLRRKGQYERIPPARDRAQEVRHPRHRWTEDRRTHWSIFLHDRSAPWDRAWRRPRSLRHQKRRGEQYDHRRSRVRTRTCTRESHCIWLAHCGSTGRLPTRCILQDPLSPKGYPRSHRKSLRRTHQSCISRTYSRHHPRTDYRGLSG